MYRLIGIALLFVFLGISFNSLAQSGTTSLCGTGNTTSPCRINFDPNDTTIFTGSGSNRCGFRGLVVGSVTDSVSNDIFNSQTLMPISGGKIIDQLPANALVQDMWMHLWHYGSGSVDAPPFGDRTPQAFQIAVVTSPYAPCSVTVPVDAPSIGASKTFPAGTIPLYNASVGFPEPRTLNLSGIVDEIANSDYGILLRNVNSNEDGFDFCATAADDSFCQADMDPYIEVSFIINNPPSAPSNPVPNDNATLVLLTTDLSWNASIDPDGDSVTYDVEFGTNSGAMSLIAPDISATSVNPPPTPGRLNPETIYFFRVTARDVHGLETVGPIWSFTTTFVEEPDSLISPLQGLDYLDLRWNDRSTDETEFRVWRSEDGVSYSQVATLGANVEEYRDYGVLCDVVDYYYYVTAYRSTDDVESIASNIINASPLECDLQPPTRLVPADGLEILNSAATPEFQWTVNYLATHYILRIRLKSGANVWTSTPDLSEAAICTDICRYTPPLSLPDNSILDWNVASVYRTTTIFSELPFYLNVVAYYSPIIIAPDGNAIVLGRGDVSYSWEDNAAAPTYQVTIKRGTTTLMNNQSFDAAEICSGGVCSIEPYLTDTAFYLNNASNYLWRVQATGPAGTGQYDEAMFSVAIPAPTAVTLLSPNDDANLDEDRPTFSWTESPNANRYTIVITGTRAVNETVYAEGICTTGTCTARIETALPDGTYQWTVRAIGSGGQSVLAAPPRDFVIGESAPQAFTLIAPAASISIYDSAPVFSWNESLEANTYVIRIYNGGANPAWTSANLSAIDVCTAGVCSYDFTLRGINLPDNRTLTWNILATNFRGSATSNTETFYSDPLVDSITLISPLGSTVTTTQPDFQWASDPNGRVDSYILTVKNPSATNEVSASGLLAASICSAGTCNINLADIPDNLRVNGAHTWTVTAVRAGYSARPSSTVGNFTADIVPLNPPLLAPADTSTVTDITPVFQWTHDPRYSDYTLVVTPPNGANLISQPFAASSICIGLSCTVDIATIAKKLSQEGIFAWHVVGTIAGTAIDKNSVTWHFTADELLPASVTLVSPGNASSISITQPVLNWDDDPLGRFDSYTVQIKNPNGTFLYNDTLPASSLCLGGTCSFDFAAQGLNLGVQGSYSWLIKGLIDATTMSRQSELWRFTLSLGLPSAVTLLSPINSVSINTVEPVLVWDDDDLSRFAQYSVIIKRASVGTPEWDFVVDAADYCSAGTCTLDLATRPEILQYQANYTWQIIGIVADSSVTVPSSLGRFTVSLGLPQQIALISPTNNFSYPTPTSTPVLRWQPDANGHFNSYIITLKSTVNGTTSTVYRTVDDSACSPTECVYDFAAQSDVIPFDGQISWSVRGEIAETTIFKNSPTWRFNVGTLIPSTAPRLTAPLTRVLNPTEVFEWTHTGFENYRLIIKMGTEIVFSDEFTAVELACTTVCSYNLALSSFAFDRENTNYVWRVEGFMDGMSEYRFAQTTIKTDMLPDTLVLTAPTVSLRITNINPSFSWECDVQDPDRPDSYSILIRRGSAQSELRFNASQVTVATDPSNGKQYCRYRASFRDVYFPADDTNYYWTLTAYRTVGNGVVISKTSTDKQFATNFSPDNFDLLSPAVIGGIPPYVSASGDPEFTWELDPALRVAEYHLALYAGTSATGTELTNPNQYFDALPDPSQLSPYICNTTTKICKVRLSQLNVGGITLTHGFYTWQVVAHNSVGIKASMQTWTFDLLGDFTNTLSLDAQALTSVDSETILLATQEVTASPVETETATVTATPEPEISEEPSAEPSSTATELISTTATEAPVSTVTETSLPTASETPSPTVTDTPSPTATESVLPTASETPSPTATETPSPTATETSLPTATETQLPSATPAPLPMPIGLNQVRLSYWQDDSVAGLAQLSIELCSDAFLLNCEVASQVSWNGQVLMPIAVSSNNLPVYQLPYGTVLSAESSRWTISGITVLEPSSR